MATINCPTTLECPGPAPCYPESGCDRSDGKYRAAGKCSEPHPLRREPEDENRTRHERDRPVQAAGSERFGTNMVHAVANLELVLKEKLEFISNNLYYPSADNGAAAQ